MQELTALSLAAWPDGLSGLAELCCRLQGTFASVSPVSRQGGKLVGKLEGADPAGLAAKLEQLTGGRAAASNGGVPQPNGAPPSGRWQPPPEVCTQLPWGVCHTPRPPPLEPRKRLTVAVLQICAVGYL